jgi:two-component system, chemotaxis family, CheB/CheR fusion protein
MARRRPKENGGGGVVPVVAIGGSAGGIPALQRFFSAVPAEPGVAFVVVLHLSPAHESHLTNVLQRSSRLQVVQVDSDREIEPNCVFVIPPNAVLTIRGNRIELKEPRSDFERRHPIDAIFRSLARDRGEQAMCVILSGSGSNGAAGAQSVREVDGIVVAQAPDSAEHPDMPRNVVMAGLADRVLAPEEMPPVLVGYARRPPPPDRPAQELARTAETEVNTILSILRTRGGHDFSPYKKSTLLRRIARRMGLGQVDGLTAYAERLRSDPEEVQALVADLLINVTGFFRDAQAWATLREEAIARIIGTAKPNQPVRVWVPACSTGEEAYTVAMLFLEEAERAEKGLDIKVFATDPEHQALARARAGLFPATVMEDVPRDLLRKYFDTEDELYRARKALRDAVIFAPQNLLSDPPFSRLDLVTCRNLLIYLETPVQEKVIALLHFALREGGYLFLGSSETVGRHRDLFQSVSKKWRIFRRVGPTRHELLDFPLLGAEHGLSHVHLRAALPRVPAEEARETLLSSFAPPSVLIDHRQRVLFIHGDMEGLLKPAAGEPTLDLFALAREDLRHRLRGAIRQAAKDQAPVSVEVKLDSGPRAGPLRITVSPLPARNHPQRFLVSFEPGAPAAPAAAARHAPAAPARTETVERQLEEELRAAREELQLTIEQLEGSNEELKASNEEITSMNEELQSTNEELETSKEELQSLNEELNTVNTQLQSKVEELEDRSNDLRNLLNSSDVGTLFLDSRHRIRWFSPALRDLFQVIQTDVGRPITDFSKRFEDETFLEDAGEVLRTLQPRWKEVPSEDGKWYLRRILPYRTEDNRIDGVVATFTDITERKRREEELAASKAFAEQIVDTTRQPLVVLDRGFNVRTANRAFLETFLLEAEEVEGRSLFDLGDGAWNIPVLRQALREAMPDSGVLSDLEVEHAFLRLGRRVMLVNARRIDDEALMLVAIEDITGRKDSEERQRMLVAELHHRHVRPGRHGDDGRDLGQEVLDPMIEL